MGTLPRTTSVERDPVDRRLEAVQAELDALSSLLGRTQRLATVGTLAAGVAHEINNILTPVLSYAHLARSRPEDAELQAKAYDKIISGVESACAVAQAVLNFSADTTESPVAPVAEVLQRTLACLARDPAKDGIELVVEIPEQLEVRMRPLALQQVLLNLILNAWSAIKGQGGRQKRTGRITVTAEAIDGGRIRIQTSDNGPGVAPDVIDRIFEPFVSTKADPTRDGDTDDPDATEGGGSGLGLMITRHLIQQAGGAITAESSDAGATFTIVVPAAGPETH